MIEISAKFEENRIGNGIAIINRFTIVLKKAISELDNSKNTMAKNSKSGPTNNDADSEPEPEAESGSDQDSDNRGYGKRRATLLASATGSKGKKSAKSTAQDSLAHSCYGSGTLDMERFIDSDNGLADFLNKEGLDSPPLANSKEYYKTYGNPMNLR
jgi:hypothetical protein